MDLATGRIIAGGTEVAADDPILERFGAHFTPPAKPAPSATVVETATAAPGELRALTPPVKRGPGRPRKVTPETQAVEKEGDGDA